jgi:hypothetical protein
VVVRTGAQRLAGACSLVLLLGLGSLLLAGCGDGGDEAALPRDTFEANLQDREGLTATQAGCVAGYVYEAYPDDAIRTLDEDGLSALPSPLWSEYGHAMVGCVLGDELGVDVSPPDGEG